MREGQFTLQDIPTDKLVPHPANSNSMDSKTLKKLRRHIEQTGRYEPLTVRPHPCETGKFQVINGHNRLRVLRALDCGAAQCIVWNINDEQAMLYLATLNRLSGKDIPERRVALLGSLLQAFDVGDLSALLPEDTKQLEELKQLSDLDLKQPDQTRVEEDAQMPVILTFFLEEVEATELNLALDLMRPLIRKRSAARWSSPRQGRTHCSSPPDIRPKLDGAVTMSMMT